MLTVSTNKRSRSFYLNNSFSEKIRFVNESDHANLLFKERDFGSYNEAKIQTHEISFIDGVRQNIDRKQVRLREGFSVDNRILPRPNFINFCFTHNDFSDIPYLIPAPLGPKFGDNQSIKNETYNNKVFWSGCITHSTRRDFLSFYNTVDDNRFDVSLFQERVYRDGFKTGTYETFLDTLSKSDIVFLLRGDRIWAHTFYDIIRAGCIPVMISSMNYYGWENIFTNVDDYMLRFDLRKHDMEYIHQQVALLLEDKERVLYMKNNIRKFHDMFFKHDCPTYGFSEFLLAKCVEIYKNDFDINKIDYKFICPEILNLKGLDSKL
jgi:hypothetical protein